MHPSIRAETNQAYIKELAASVCLGKKVAIEHTVKTTANSQLALHLRERK